MGAGQSKNSKGPVGRSVKEVFGNEKFVIGMIHLKSTPDKSCLERAILETEQYISNGVDAILVEDYFGSRDDMEEFLGWLKKNRPNICFGVNYLQSYVVSYQLALKYRAKFIQHDSVSGHLTVSEELEFEQTIMPFYSKRKVFVIGGVRFKYQPLRSERSLEDDLKAAMTRCDAICVTGSRTGEPTSIEKIKEYRSFIGNFPLIVGAGLTPENVKESLVYADGGIVGSYFKAEHKDRGDVDPEHVKEFMSAVESVREAETA